MSFLSDDQWGVSDSETFFFFSLLKNITYQLLDSQNWTVTLSVFNIFNGIQDKSVLTHHWVYWVKKEIFFSFSIQVFVHLFLIVSLVQSCVSFSLHFFHFSPAVSLHYLTFLTCVSLTPPPSVGLLLVTSLSPRSSSRFGLLFFCVFFFYHWLKFDFWQLYLHKLEFL